MDNALELGVAVDASQALLMTFQRDRLCASALPRQVQPVMVGDRLRNVRQYLETHVTYSVTVEQMAELAHLGRSRFHRVPENDRSNEMTLQKNKRDVWVLVGQSNMQGYPRPGITTSRRWCE